MWPHVIMALNPCSHCNMWVQLEENMYRAFKHFDTDNSGTISKEELTEALKVRSLPSQWRSSARI